MIFTVEQNMQLAGTDQEVTGLKIDGKDIIGSCFQFDESEGWADVFEHLMADGKPCKPSLARIVNVNRLHGRIEVTRGGKQ